MTKGNGSFRSHRKNRRLFQDFKFSGILDQSHTSKSRPERQAQRAQQSLSPNVSVELFCEKLTKNEENVTHLKK